MLQRREWRLPGPSRADDRGRRPFVAPDAYPPPMSQPRAASPEGRPERAPLPTDPAGLPELGDEFAAVLGSGLMSLDVTLSEGVRRAIDAQVRLLLAWNQHINLTAIRTPEAIARLHVLDSLSARAACSGIGSATLLPSRTWAAGAATPGCRLRWRSPRVA